MRIHTTILASALACSLAPTAFAQPPFPVGDQTVANATLEGDQDDVAVGLDAAGDFVVVWRADAQDGDGSGIVARRFDGRSGEPLSDELLVNVSTAGNQVEPAVAVAPDGSFVVVWAGPEADGSSGIFGSLRDADGAPIVAEFRSNDDPAGDQRQPAVAIQPGGEFLIGWQSDTASPLVGTEIVARIFDAQGNPGAEFPVNRILIGNQARPAVAADPADGGWHSVWQGLDLLSLVPSVFHLKLLAGGPPSPDIIETLLNLPILGARRNVRIAGDAGGEAVAVWEGRDGDGQGIFSRSISKGVPIGVEERVNLDPAGDQREPTVALDAHDRFVVAWIHELSGASPLGSPIVVQGRKKGRQTGSFGSTGPDAEFRIDSFGDRPSRPAVATTPGGDFVVAWDVRGVDQPSDPDGRAAVFQRFVDPLFADGFESGGFGNWTFGVP